ncbi:MAG TPA: proline--tRNA ligase [Candidatus Paceibacterota bacterium]|nr:proline--tRNA ligase [Candidatus Paceibacterota bacterium]
MENVFEKRHLTKKSENISEWYNDVVLQAGLADYAETKGCIIFRPYSYALWERIQATLDPWFKKDGVQNAYFPLLIPYHLLKKEKEHVEGFSPELAVVTKAGGEDLAEPLVVRPTSETIMYQTFAKWVQSYRDLPLKINQWCNIVRWEKRTHPFLRTTEFLWQEGHTAHATADEADAMAKKALGWYKKFYEEYAALAPYVGVKSASERFAGAEETYSIEVIVPDGKALQAATSHDLADHFSKVFEIEFLDETGRKVNPHQTSWGLSTRAIGGIILVHGDDAGLIMPPRLAPVQVVVLTVAGKDGLSAEVESYAKNIIDKLENVGLRAALDVNVKQSLGYRINEWELKGVPLRLEVGAREVKEEKVAFARRDTLAKGSFDKKDLVEEVGDLLDNVHAELYARSLKLKKDLTKDVATYADFKAALADQKYFLRAPWCEDAACEAKVKEETKATTRVLEFEEQGKTAKEKCFACGAPAKHRWLFAQSY